MGYRTVKQSECWFTKISCSPLPCHASLHFRTEHLLPPTQHQTEKNPKDTKKIENCQILESYNLLLSLQKSRKAKFFWVRDFFVCVCFVFKAIHMEGFLVIKNPGVSALLSMVKERLLHSKTLINSSVRKMPLISCGFFFLNTYHLLPDSP